LSSIDHDPVFVNRHVQYRSRKDRAERSLVALTQPRDLLVSAKDLLIEAMAGAVGLDIELR
jgi:hypothetical protein